MRSGYPSPSSCVRSNQTGSVAGCFRNPEVHGSGSSMISGIPTWIEAMCFIVFKPSDIRINHLYVWSVVCAQRRARGFRLCEGTRRNESHVLRSHGKNHGVGFTNHWTRNSELRPRSILPTRSRLNELLRRSQIIACHVRCEQLDHHAVLDPEFDDVESATR